MENSVNSSAKRTWKNINAKISATGMFLDKKEVDFFAAVKNNDINFVKRMLNANKCVKRDAINSDGKTAFQIAAENNKIPMIRELLNGIKERELYSVLSQCVVSNNLDCIKKIISELPETLEIENNENEMMELINEAAHLKHYEIVYFFIQNDFLIEENHKCSSICTVKDNERMKHLKVIHKSQVTLNRFKGLTNPVYICLR